MATKEKTGSTINVAVKTCSLFGRRPSTAEYYRKIGTLADCLLELEPDILDLIRTLEQDPTSVDLDALSKLVRDG